MHEILMYDVEDSPNAKTDVLLDDQRPLTSWRVYVAVQGNYTTLSDCGRTLLTIRVPPAWPSVCVTQVHLYLAPCLLDVVHSSET